MSADREMSPEMQAALADSRPDQLERHLWHYFHAAANALRKRHPITKLSPAMAAREHLSIVADEALKLLALPNLNVPDIDALKLIGWSADAFTALDYGSRGGSELAFASMQIGRYAEKLHLGALRADSARASAAAKVEAWHPAAFKIYADLRRKQPSMSATRMAAKIKTGLAQEPKSNRGPEPDQIAKQVRRWLKAEP